MNSGDICIIYTMLRRNLKMIYIRLGKKRIKPFKDSIYGDRLIIPDIFGGITKFDVPRDRIAYSYNDKETKINFACLQILIAEKVIKEGSNLEFKRKYSKKVKEWKRLFIKVIKEYFNIKTISFDISPDIFEARRKHKWYGYINEEYSVLNDKNIEIFRNEIILKKFLFAPDSSIIIYNRNKIVKMNN